MNELWSIDSIKENYERFMNLIPVTAPSMECISENASIEEWNEAWVSASSMYKGLLDDASLLLG